MIVLLPSIILLIAMLVVLILGRTRSRLGTAWIISAALVYFTWVGVILLHLRFPDALIMSHWLPGMISSDVLSFELNASSWMIAVPWLALAVSVLFASSGLLEDPAAVRILAGSLGLAAVTLLSITSSSLLSFLITWTLIDLIDFILLIGTVPDRDMMKMEVTSLTFQVAGTFLVLAATAITGSAAIDQSTIASNSTVMGLLLLGAGLRMGALPLHISFTPEETVRRTLGSLLRLASPISAFALLLRLPAPIEPGSFSTLAALAGIAAIFGALMWATALNEMNGRQYWVLSLGGIGLLSVLSGETEMTAAAAGILVTVGGFLFLFPLKERRLESVFIFLLITMTALPLTPYSGAWKGGWSSYRWIEILSLGLLVLGALRHERRKEITEADQQNWIMFFNRAGLIVLALTPWISLIWKESLLQLAEGWWNALILIGIIIAGILFYRFVRTRLDRSDRVTQFSRDLAVTGIRGLRTVFRFEWLLNLSSWLYRQLQRVVWFLEGILEGEGGFLWSLVFLALLISVLASVGK